MFSNKLVFGGAILASTVSGALVGLLGVKGTAYVPSFMAPFLANEGHAVLFALCMLVAMAVAFVITVIANRVPLKRGELAARRACLCYLSEKRLFLMFYNDMAERMSLGMAKVKKALEEGGGHTILSTGITGDDARMARAVVQAGVRWSRTTPPWPLPAGTRASPSCTTPRPSATRSP